MMHFSENDDADDEKEIEMEIRMTIESSFDRFIQVSQAIDRANETILGLIPTTCLLNEAATNAFVTHIMLTIDVGDTPTETQIRHLIHEISQDRLREN